MPSVFMTVSMTEVPQYRRLVRFIMDIEDYARLTADEDLANLVMDLRSDLLEQAST